MNRVIKFRAWYEENSLMVYDVHLGTYKGETIFTAAKEMGGELMQFTGLLDRNGVEIYEGDILGGFNPKYEHERGKPSIVKWDAENACFTIYRGETSSGYATRSEVGWNEILGNIYESPELLK